MSEFWVRKMKTYFQRIDFDKDGVITQKDFEAMAERFVKREKLDDVRGKELKSKLLQASSVAFINKWTHGHDGTDGRTDRRTHGVQHLMRSPTEGRLINNKRTKLSTSPRKYLVDDL